MISLFLDPGIDGRIKLKITCRSWMGEGEGIVWIDVAQVRDRWRGLVNAVINLRI
jgi:hypothetical protein